MDIRILLISRGRETTRIYRDALEKFDAQVVPVESFTGLDRETEALRFHGVAVDLPTKIKALKNNKEFIYGILGKFPLIQLKLNKKTGEINSFQEGGPGNDDLKTFIERASLVANPRRFRHHPRKSIHFNVIVSRNKDFAKGDVERSITMNVSEDGCQILSFRKWEPGGDVWLVINELSDKTPMRCKVRHAIAWGEAMAAPGIGLEFEEITKKQARELRDKFLRSPFDAPRL